MTTPTPADAVRAAVHGLSTLEFSPDEIAAAAIRAAADALLPRPISADLSPWADRERLQRFEFIFLANELDGTLIPAASREALAEAREKSHAAATDTTPAALPPRPLINDSPKSPLVRYGVTWQGGRNEPLLTPMDDGYWTPWWTAADALATAREAPARLRHCPTHGQQGPESWGCPECLRELREELATAREALRRLVAWGGFHSFRDATLAQKQAVLTVLDWFADGMTGPLPPLPPLPPHIASRDSSAAATPPASVLPPALVLDGGDGVRIESTNHERTSWAVRDGNWCLNFSGRWECEPFSSSRDAGYLARTRWPSAAAAWEALQQYREMEANQSAMAAQVKCRGAEDD